MNSSYFMAPSDEQIKGLKETYKGVQLLRVQFSYNPDKFAIIRVVNHSEFNEYRRQQIEAVGQNKDLNYIALKFFVVYPEITEDVYKQDMLSGEIETLINVIMTSHGYVEPVVEEL